MRWFLVIFPVMLLFNSCSSQLYRVAPVPKAASPTLSEEGIKLTHVARLLTSDELLEQFDANLLLAGVIVVDVKVANRSVTTQTLRFALQDTAGGLYKPLAPKQALGRVMKFYGNLLFAQAAYANTLAHYEALACPHVLTLEPQAEKRGFLYFAAPTDATAIRGLRLNAAGISINLNE